MIFLGINIDNHANANDRLTSAAFHEPGAASPHRGTQGSIQPAVVYPRLPEVEDFLEACKNNNLIN